MQNRPGLQGLLDKSKQIHEKAKDSANKKEKTEKKSAHVKIEYTQDGWPKAYDSTKETSQEDKIKQAQQDVEETKKILASHMGTHINKIHQEHGSIDHLQEKSNNLAQHKDTFKKREAPDTTSFAVKIARAACCCFFPRAGKKQKDPEKESLLHNQSIQRKY